MKQAKAAFASNQGMVLDALWMMTAITTRLEPFTWRLVIKATWAWCVGKTDYSTWQGLLIVTPYPKAKEQLMLHNTF
jgi:hypothetical protein